MASLSPIPSVSKDHFFSLSQLQPSKDSTATPVFTNIFGSKEKLGRIEQSQLRLCSALKNNSGLRANASREPLGLTRELEREKQERLPVNENESDLFDEMKQRFLNFKKNKYMENLRHFECLARSQTPKFMVIACADSRVCPSNILGFQPGEAFIVRNVANMVPPYESGPAETKAALEFAVNSLEVENILIIGHSCCGGIRALMSMHDDVETSSFIGSWISVGMDARLKTKAAVSDLSFDRQCRHCEKVSVNCSLSNLLTYPWIEEKVRSGEVSIHGGYYNFVDCSFEKWTLDYEDGESIDANGNIAIKNQSYWS